MVDRSTTATRHSWRNLDFSGPFVEIPWQDSFSKPQFDLIRRGAIPEEMEDRWFAFYEEPELFLHRSWSGLCFYRVTFARYGERYAVQSARVRDWEGLEIEDEVKFIDFLVHRLLLEEPRPFPRLRRHSVPPPPPRRGFIDRWLRRWRKRGTSGTTLWNG